MPIVCDIDVEPIGEEEFHEIDERVMRFAFDIHNEIGRFFREDIYNRELARRCRVSGLQAEREVGIVVRHDDFVYRYSCDLVVEKSVPYELKTTHQIIGDHEKQAINYLLLMGLHHGGVINFRPASVQRRLVSTKLTHEKRCDYQICDGNLACGDEPTANMRQILCDLFDDWGLFLGIELYRKALIHFLGGPDACVQEVDICVDGDLLGQQKMCLLDKQTALHMSAIHQHTESYAKHIRRILKTTPLHRIQWVNIHKHRAMFRTIHK